MVVVGGGRSTVYGIGIKDLKKMAGAPVNAKHLPPQHKWLMKSFAKAPQCKQRLEMLGNAVIPKQSETAVRLLVHMFD